MTQRLTNAPDGFLLSEISVIRNALRHDCHKTRCIPNGMPARIVLLTDRLERLLASFQDARPFWEVPAVSLRSTAG
jgi:hypothetical protein